MKLTKTLLHTTDAYIKKLNQAGIETVENFISMYPRDIEDKSSITSVFAHANVKEKQSFLAKIELITSERTRNNKLLIKCVLIDDNDSYMELVWFNRKFLLQQYRSGDRVIVYGQPKYQYGKLSMNNAEIEHYRENRQELSPVYSDVNYISGTWIAKKMPLFKKYITNLSEQLPANILEKKKMRNFGSVVMTIHFPSSLNDWEQAKSEIAYRELYTFQKRGIEKKYKLQHGNDGNAHAIPLDSDTMKMLIEDLPFSLTDKQKIVLFQALKDIEHSYPMSRMLQGDVGTGKTIVALLITIHSILEWRKMYPEKYDFQVVFMAPTEILARQHFAESETLLAKYSIASDLLVGSLTPKNKKLAQSRLKNGEVQVVFGTHALVQDAVGFQNFGLAIIDEQHRFGVKQREILESGGGNETKIIPHILNMTATPIPRSLALTLYGDQDISVLDEYPAGRKEIHTRVVRESQRGEVYRWITESVEQGRQVYWISPLVEESDTLDVTSATQMFEQLEIIFPQFSVGLIHGKMKAKEKDAIMQDFYDGKIQILSSTSVVEVGVNNPNATVMCIEGSERFGLSQLHQFRGRVGRGEHQSYCYLFTTKEYKTDRLKAMEQTNDGFILANTDLELRGPGEVYGVRQSGLPDLHFADIRDVNMVSEVRADIEESMRGN